MWQTSLGHCIYQTNDNLFIYQNPLYRWLTFGSSAIQTIIHRYRPQKCILSYIPAMTIAARLFPGDCCLLGLGGAGVAHALLPFLSQFKITAIESSTHVIDVAKSYFMTDKIGNLNIIHQDANHFVHTQSASFQHIFVDLFDAHSFPKHCFTRDFFARCKKLLKPMGTLAINIANVKEQKPILKFIREEFHLSWMLLPVPKTTNIILLAYHHESILPLITLFKQQGLIEKVFWDEYWGYIAEIPRHSAG